MNANELKEIHDSKECNNKYSMIVFAWFFLYYYTINIAITVIIIFAIIVIVICFTPTFAFILAPHRLLVVGIKKKAILAGRCGNPKCLINAKRNFSIALQSPPGSPTLGVHTRALLSCSVSILLHLP